jgi:hypothetical protein
MQHLFPFALVVILVVATVGACALPPEASDTGRDATAGSGRSSAVASLPSTPSPIPRFCDHSMAVALLGDVERALSAEDGTLLATLIDPAHGMDTRLIRNGTTINYDRTHAQELFSSDYAVNWGAGAGSGLPVIGSFRALVAPALLEVLTSDYTLECDRIRTGGATYEPTWPYTSGDFYSAFFPGTEPNGLLDWRTWVFGIRMENGTPYLYAILQFLWEP